MLASERTRYIISQLSKKGIINLKDVAKELSISDATVRRDFEKLENEGKLKHVTGGATLSDNADDHGSAELTMRAKKLINYDGKIRAARAASEQVNDGECIFIDGGTSAAAVVLFFAVMFALSFALYWALGSGRDLAVDALLRAYMM